MLALDVNNLTKTYSNGVKALDDLSLQVKQGEFLGLLGPNGAGKTTFISILNSLVFKTSGQVVVYGHNVDSEFSLAKSCIGTVPQEFNFSIFEKISDIVINQAGFYGLSRSDAKKRAQKYLSMFGLWEKRKHSARSLSGGMKRRLMIARAMMHEPKCLILDEPTAGVDIELRRSMWALLQEINSQNITIILTTHYLEEAEYLCDRIAIVNKGKLITDMSKKDLIKQLKTESFIFDLKEPLDNDQLNNSSILNSSGLRFTLIDSFTMQVDLHHGNTVNDIFSLLNEIDVVAVSMRNKSNRLEELFLNYTQNNQDAS